MNEEIFNKEKAHFDIILSKLKIKIEEESNIIDNKKKEIIKTKEEYYKEKSSLDDWETITSMNEIDKDVDKINEEITKLNKLKRSIKKPYFARIDFSNNRKEKIYIGINGISINNDILVHDWRSPIASLYYNYDIGPSSYESPEGIINGNITLKRQFEIENSKLISYYDNNLGISEKEIEKVITNRTGEMTNIIESIEKEQNQIIRNEKDRYLIIEGPAGSGKSVIALHRVAYLLYQDNNINNDNILILSPNKTFIKYISNILPELGEENVINKTYNDIKLEYLKDINSIESRNDFINRILSSKDINNIKNKLSDNMINEIDIFYNDLINNINIIKDIKINNKLITKEKLNEILKTYKKFPLYEALNELSIKLCDNLLIKTKYHKEILINLYKILNINIDLLTLYNEFIHKHNLIFNKKDTIEYEDSILIFYLYNKLNGYNIDNNIKHIIIDELQDYTLLEILIIKNMYPKASFTLLGDPNQNINKLYKYDNLKLIGDFLNINYKYIKLYKTYRSIKSITDYSNNILKITDVISVRKKDKTNIIKRNINEFNSNIYKDIMLNNENKNICIITKTNDIAVTLYNELSTNNKNIYLNKFDMNIVSIMPVSLAKGLEFDEVIIYNDIKDPYTKEDINLYYVAATRALNKLTIYNEPSFI